MGFDAQGFDAEGFTAEVMGRVDLKVGKLYEHPEDGAIQITSGQWWGTHGLSNFWYWNVLETDEQHHGYGGQWPEITTLTDVMVRRFAHDLSTAHGYARMILPPEASPTDKATLENARAAFARAELALPALAAALAAVTPKEDA